MLVKIVEKNPDLIILTDDVYGTFAEDFRTVYSVLPHNTILVYSFSKLYGVTGWRVGLPVDDSGQNTGYYALVDLREISEARYGDEFTDWLSEYRSDLDLLNDLAAKKGVVLMYGPGFEAPEGTVRISLANLDSEDYVEIARRLYELLDEYYAEFEAETVSDQAA